MMKPLLLRVQAQATASRPATRAPPPSLQFSSAMVEAIDGVGETLSNAGETVVFDNVNIGSQLMRIMRQLSCSVVERERFRRAFGSLASGLDEMLFIAAYLLLVDRLLKNAWRATRWVHRLPHQWGNLEPKKEAITDQSFETSLAGVLREPARLFGWSMLLLWLVDAAYVLAVVVNPSLATQRKLPNVISCLVYTYCSGRAIASIKNWWLDKAALVLKPPPSRAQRAIARRGTGILLWSILLLLCSEAVTVATGVKLNSILSFAGVGGIAVGLATKDLLTNLVGGCLLFLTNSFAERDKITMTNLDESRVLRIGWYQTVVRGNDEQVQTIPNAKFISNKISNRSRRTHRCVKQSIFLTYDALPIADDLIEEMRVALLKLPTVDARKREFRVYLKSLTQTALEIEVEVHFKGNDGTAFRGKRQALLLTIADVVARRGAKFAVLDSLLAGERADVAALDELDDPLRS